MIASGANPSEVLLEWAEDLLQCATGLEHTASFPGAGQKLDEVAAEFGQVFESLTACFESLAAASDDPSRAERLASCARATRAAREAVARLARDGEPRLARAAR